MEPMRYTMEQSWEVTELICKNFRLSTPQSGGTVGLIRPKREWMKARLLAGPTA
jgi:hypothetical protein